MKQTAIEWLEKEFVKLESTVGVHSIMYELIEQAKEKEAQQLKDAIMYALDEDGHTGDWKIKFANDYIKQYETSK